MDIFKKLSFLRSSQSVAEVIPSLKCNSRTKYQFWRLLHSCAIAHIQSAMFAISKLDVFFSRAILAAKNESSYLLIRKSSYIIEDIIAL